MRTKVNEVARVEMSRLGFIDMTGSFGKEAEVEGRPWHYGMAGNRAYVGDVPTRRSVSPPKLPA